MRKLILSFAIIAVMAFTAANVYAVSFQTIQSILPKTKITKVINTPIAGLYGALMPNGQIVYVYPSKKLLVFGQIWTNTGKNLTDASMTKMQSSKAALITKAVNLSDAVKIGHGPVKVIEFANIDCPYCKAFEKLTTESKSLRDKMTRYLFLIPQPSIHPHSTEMTLYYFTKTQHLNDKEKVALLNKIMVKHIYLTKSGNIPPKFKQSGYAMRKLEYDTALAQKFSIYGVPYFIIKNQAVLGLNIGKIYKLLGIKTVNIKKIQSNIFKNFK
ncbi:MAG: disulfide isomerase DsbC N-terminal domain-containing protein [bacterium]